MATIVKNLKELPAQDKDAQNLARPPAYKRKNLQDGSFPKQDKAELAFRLMDKDRDGTITKKEMVKMFKTLSMEQAFSKFDLNEDGKLSIEEFRKMMKK